MILVFFGIGFNKLTKLERSMMRKWHVPWNFETKLTESTITISIFESQNSRVDHLTCGAG